MVYSIISKRSKQLRLVEKLIRSLVITCSWEILQVDKK